MAALYTRTENESETPWNNICNGEALQAGKNIVFLDTCTLQSGSQWILGNIDWRVNTGNAQKEEIRVFPNPVLRGDILHIQNKYEKGRLQIYNAEGTVVLEQRKNGQALEIKVSQFPAGTYFYKWQTEDRIYHGQFMVLD
jgi:hypothetical protein